MSTRSARGHAETGRPPRRRPRPTPKWLIQTQEIDQIAKARCLVILDVLSGRTPVSDAIQAGKLSRGTYYQLETRALAAMLTALTPGAGPTPASGPDRLATARHVARLEAQVRRLEQARRRAERLLVLTRKVIHPRRLTTSPGGPGRPRSIRAGRPTSPPSTPEATPATRGSAPTRAGAAAP